MSTTRHSRTSSNSFVKTRFHRRKPTKSRSPSCSSIDLGDPEDLGYVQFLGIRLMRGQLKSGGWNYECPYGPLSANENARLGTALRKKERPTAEVGDRPALHPEVVKWSKLVNPKKKHRHRYRQFEYTIRNRGNMVRSQAWGSLRQCHRARGQAASSDTAARWRLGVLLQPRTEGSAGVDAINDLRWLDWTGSRTGVIASGRFRNGSDDALDDPAIKKALKRLGEFLRNGDVEPNRLSLDEMANDLYFLWSLERIGVIYGFKTIGNRDWYAWGSETLLRSQK